MRHPSSPPTSWHSLRLPRGAGTSACLSHHEPVTPEAAHSSAQAPPSHLMLADHLRRGRVQRDGLRTAVPHGTAGRARRDSRAAPTTSGTQFDPDAVDAFLSVLAERGPMAAGLRRCVMRAIVRKLRSRVSRWASPSIERVPGSASALNALAVPSRAGRLARPRRRAARRADRPDGGTWGPRVPRCRPESPRRSGRSSRGAAQPPRRRSRRRSAWAGVMCISRTASAITSGIDVM